jgi:uncharacterized membrane protein
MTLLVLDVRVPVSEAGAALSDHGLWAALLTQGPNFAAYLLSFSMLGTFWLAQHGLLGILGRCDRTLTWISLGFLFVVSLLPFSAALLAHYVHLRLAVGVYWLNIVLLGAGLEASARYGRRALVPADAGPARSRLAVFRRRILLAQTLYTLAALVCLASTVASVIALAVVQLYFNRVAPVAAAERAAPGRLTCPGRVIKKGQALAPAQARARTVARWQT